MKAHSWSKELDWTELNTKAKPILSNLKSLLQTFSTFSHVGYKVSSNNFWGRGKYTFPRPPRLYYLCSMIDLLRTKAQWWWCWWTMKISITALVIICQMKIIGWEWKHANNDLRTNIQWRLQALYFKLSSTICLIKYILS